uniref:Importin-7 n=1 Tax=Aceria tosichella TaxID=561515 RepID=A0A6G1S9U3_9ACAR
MDKARILDLLRKTADPDAKVREPAEQQLNAIYKIIGFCPTLLECVLHPDLEVHIKQAAVIYLKNNILKYWDTRNLTVTENGHPDPSQFIIHEHDKKIITDSIVDAIVSCRNDLICVHLSSIVNLIIKSDFPHKWPDVVNKIHYYLAQSNDPNAWSGAMVTFHQLAKIYEYRNQNDRKPFLEALAILLPASCQRLTQLLQSDPLSEQSCKLQKQILKTFHATLQYSLPLAILSRETFTQWMALITEIAKRDVPDMAQKFVDKEDRPSLIWWKCKKWSLHLLARIFERYGSPNSVQREYKDFAGWYINTFSYPVIQTIIKILEQYALGQYVSPRVMQQALNYLNTAVLHSMTWKMLKNDMMTVVEKIIFPLMCHSDEDEELWTADPREYIRMKYDIFEEYISPVSASQNLLHSLCKKRRDMLQKTMAFVIDVLNKQQAEPRAKDGVLHMVGSIADVLNKKPLFQDQMEQLLAAYVFPQFSCPQGFLRARACWTLNHFASIEFKNPANIIVAAQAVLHCITVDTELPVKVEASLCLLSLLNSQPATQDVIRPHVNVLTHELVNLIRSTENEDVMEVLQKIVYTFPDDLVPIAVDLTNHLAHTFHSLIDSGDTEEDEKISAAVAILSTIDTVLTMMDEKKRSYCQIGAYCC